MNDGYIPCSFTGGLTHGIIAEAVVGELIAGNRCIIGNEEKSVLITGDGITIKNGVIQSANYSDEDKTGSIIQLTDGTFSFAGGKLTYDGETLSIDGTVTAIDGRIANFNISEDELYTDDYDFDSESNDNKGIYFGKDGLVIGNNFNVNKNGNIKIEGNIFLKNGLWMWFDDKYGMGEGSKFYQCLEMSYESDAPVIICYSDMHTKNNLTVDGNLDVYGTLYAASSNVTSSDRNLKYDIQELDKENSSKFIYSLKPSKFKYNNGTSGRFHHGLIAQDVKESLGDEDNAVYVEKKDGTKGIRYEELIADMIATIQLQNERISYLEGKINNLK